MNFETRFYFADKWKDELMRLDAAILNLARDEADDSVYGFLWDDYNRIFEMAEELPNDQVEKEIHDLEARVRDLDQITRAMHLLEVSEQLASR